MNYQSHLIEQDGRYPKKPFIFSKAASCLIKNNEKIVCPKEVQQLDYEVELAIIIGSKAFKVEEEKALDHIYGYTIINDVSARDIQSLENQWYRSKSFYSFAPIGPEIIPREKISNPNDLNIKSYVNGELRQNSNTSDMVWKVKELISYISNSILLNPGDLIATGTPAGVAVFSKNAEFLKPGDIVTCKIEGLGSISNEVISEV